MTELEELRIWKQQVIEWFSKDILAINFLRDQVNMNVQMQGAYDGAMSADCKELYRRRYVFLQALQAECNSTEEESDG